MNHRRGVVLIVFFMFLKSAVSEIKLELPPTKDEEERGVRAGEFKIKPVLHVEEKYNTNLFREDLKRETPDATHILRILPGFSIFNPNPRLFKLRFTGTGEIREYLSSNPFIKEQSRFGGEADFSLSLIPKHHFGFKIFNTFKRELQTRNYSTVSTYDRNVNRGGAVLSLVPGAGALKIDMEYAFYFDFFDEFEEGTYRYHEARGLITWKFLPKTAFFIESIYRVYEYKISTSKIGLINYNSKPIRIFAGMNGYITKKLALFFKGGYANGFYEKGPNFEGFVGEFGIGYKPAVWSVFSFGYMREFEDSFFGNYYTTHSGYARVQQQLFRKLNFDIRFKYDYIQYSQFEHESFSTHSRKDNGYNLDAFLDFSIARFIGIFVGYKLDAINTDFFSIVSPPYGIDYGGYIAQEFFGGLKLLY